MICMPHYLAAFQTSHFGFKIEMRQGPNPKNMNGLECVQKLVHETFQAQNKMLF